MLLQNKKVAVIGAGPVGLAFARLLQQGGINIKVYERDANEHTRIKGGTLDLLKDMGQVVFEKVGLLNAYFDNARPTARRIADIQGDILQTIPSADNPEINRNDLRRILSQSLQPDSIVWDRNLLKLEEQNGRFILNFESGIIETADLVVGANGIMSRLRKMMTDQPVKYTGTIAITGEVFDYEINCPNFKKLAGDDKVIVRDGNNFFYCQPKANGELYYYLCFRQPETWVKDNNLDINDNKQIVEFLSVRCLGWNMLYNELFEATDNFTMLPLYQVPLEDWRSHKNITLIGDAAHGMPPYAGVGINTGLLDASHLAENLLNGKFDSIQDAIDDYEKKMFYYASEAQQQTAMNEKQLFS
jgi:tetracycline resistance monooxygenase